LCLIQGRVGKTIFTFESHTHNYLVWVWHCVRHFVVVSVRERKCDIMCRFGVCVCVFMRQGASRKTTTQHHK
jgi:hypothetical protein